MRCHFELGRRRGFARRWRHGVGRRAPMASWWCRDSVEVVESERINAGRLHITTTQVPDPGRRVRHHLEPDRLEGRGRGQAVFCPGVVGRFRRRHQPPRRPGGVDLLSFLISRGTNYEVRGRRQGRFLREADRDRFARDHRSHPHLRQGRHQVDDGFTT